MVASEKQFSHLVELRINGYREIAMFANEQLVGPYRRWYRPHPFHAVSRSASQLNRPPRARRC